MPKLNPPPQRLPEELGTDLTRGEFFRKLLRAVYSLFYAAGGKDGLPTLNIMSDHDSGGSDGYNELTGATDTPLNDPGFGSSSSADMTNPDGYIRFRVGTQAVAVPYWTATGDETDYVLLEDDGQIDLEDGSGAIINEETE